MVTQSAESIRLPMRRLGRSTLLELDVDRALEELADAPSEVVLAAVWDLHRGTVVASRVGA